MKILKIILIYIAAAGIVFCTYKVSTAVIEYKNLSYVEEQPLAMNKNNENVQNSQDFSQDVDKMISHIVEGTKGQTLPVKYDKNYTVYENSLYVTNNKGKTWLKVPNDNTLGYARINEYLDDISKSNIYVSTDKIAVIYGGRGSENISIITTESQGDVWSAGSISKTATHDLKKGYDKIYIDFPGNGSTGYVAAIKSDGTQQIGILIFRSVNAGVTWDSVGSKDALYNKIKEHFGLQGMYL